MIALSRNTYIDINQQIYPCSGHPKNNKPAKQLLLNSKDTRKAASIHLEPIQCSLKKRSTKYANNTSQDISTQHVSKGLLNAVPEVI